jgi:hypothetical protein
MPSRSWKIRPVVGLLLALWGCEADVAATDDAGVQGAGGGATVDAGPQGGVTGEGGQADACCDGLGAEGGMVEDQGGEIEHPPRSNGGDQAD